MHIWQSIILGIVEGITEFLPISSTGHLILAGDLLKIPANTFSKSFDIVIQLGAILAVIFIFWHKLWNFKTIKRLIVAFIPTGIIGLLLYKIVKTYLLGNTSVVLWAMFLGGIFLIIFEIWYKRKKPSNSNKTFKGFDEDFGPQNNIIENSSHISYKQAFSIGLFQSISIIPGVSRSAATILGGLFLGLKRTTIVEFSFLLAVPTILAASGLDLVKNYSLFSWDQFGVLATGFVVSFIVALLSIKFLLSFVKKYSFISFGIYRIIIALVFLVYLMHG